MSCHFCCCYCFCWSRVHFNLTFTVLIIPMIDHQMHIALNRRTTNRLDVRRKNRNRLAPPSDWWSASPLSGFLGWSPFRRRDVPGRGISQTPAAPETFAIRFFDRKFRETRTTFVVRVNRLIRVVTRTGFRLAVPVPELEVRPDGRRRADGVAVRKVGIRWRNRKQSELSWDQLECNAPF